MAELSYRKRARDDSADFETEFGFDSKRIREDLLSLLDDFDTVPDDRDSPSQELDSVIRSFEEEISGSGTRPGSPKPDNFVDLTSDSGDSLPELGHLLGYDELEAPAPVPGGEVAELLRISSESSGIGEFWDFQDELPSYDSFGFGMGYMEYNNSHSGQGDNDEYVALDGIFDYSDVNFGSDVTWRPETLPAL